MTDPLMEKGLPSYVGGEQIILGTALIDSTVIDELSKHGTIYRYEFFLESHRQLFDWMPKLRAQQMPISPETLCAGKTEAEIERIGGRSYIALLVNYAVAPSTVEYYAGLVRKKALLRRLIHTANQAITQAIDGDEDAESIVATALSAFEKLPETSGGLKVRFELIHASELARPF